MIIIIVLIIVGHVLNKDITYTFHILIVRKKRFNTTLMIVITLLLLALIYYFMRYTVYHNFGFGRYLHSLQVTLLNTFLP